MVRLSPPPSEPAKRAFLLRAIGRIDRSTVFESITIRASSRSAKRALLGRQLRRGQSDHAIFDLRSTELAVFQSLEEQTHAGRVPEDQFDPVCPLEAKHIHNAGNGLAFISSRISQLGRPLLWESRPVSWPRSRE
jgi:hypothetical protein